MWIVDIYMYIYIYYSICGIQALMMVHMGFLFHSFIFYYCGSTVFFFLFLSLMAFLTCSDFISWELYASCT